MGANPQGLDREGRRDLYFFIHNVYANFFKDALDYFSLHLYPRFEYKVVGTYDKAVEYLNKMCELNKEANKPNLPALVLNPSGDFDLADANAGGKQLWRFPNLAPGMLKRIFNPVYQDENVEIDVGFMRMQGDLELLMLLNSFYEYCDLKMLMLEIFGGFERWIYPQYFSTFIIIPEELRNYQYTNPYTGLTYTLDWASAGAYDRLVRTIAREELVIPCNIKPTYKLTSLSDGSQRYGGADQLADWRLTAVVRYEIEIPAFLVLQSDYLAQDINLRITAGSTYSNYDYTVPDYQWRSGYHKDWGLDETSSSIIDTDSTEEQTYTSEYDFEARFYYIVTQADVDSTSNLFIAFDNPDLTYLSGPGYINDPNAIRVNSRYGEMNYGDHYVFYNNNTGIEIKTDNVELTEGMVIELYTYRKTS